jgi:DivIVA domain-containing protein
VALVWVLLAIVVLGGVAVVAAGRGQGLTAAEPDRPDLSVPPDRPLRRTDVDMLRFSVGLRGYRMDEVDDVLDRLAYDLEARDARIAILEQEVAARWSAATTPAEGHPSPDGDAQPVEASLADGATPEPVAAETGPAEAESSAEAEDEVDEVDEGELLVGRTLIVPFQQTDSRFGSGAGEHGEPSAGAGDARPGVGDEGPERGA